MESTLRLETEVKYGKTIIKDMYFTAPYKIMSPFENNGHIDVMLMSASAGMLSGDSFEGEFVFGKGSDVACTSQSYEKVFRSLGEQTVRKNRILVKEGAKAVFLPCPVIPFAGSDYVSETTARVSQQSSFLYGDIFSCGRSGMGEQFQMKSYRSRTRIYVGEKLVFADHTWMNPEQFDYRSTGMWEGYTHNGLLYVYCGKAGKAHLMQGFIENQEKEDRRNDIGGEERQLIEQIRQQASLKNFLTGVTACERGIAVRVLAMSGDDILKLFRWIAERF